MIRKRPRLPSIEGPAYDLPVLMVEYGGRKITLRRNQSYQETIACLRRSFAELSGKRVAILARIAEFNDTLEITEDSWAVMLPHLSRVTIQTLDLAPDHKCNCGCQRIFIQTPDGKRTPLYISFRQTISTLVDKIHDALGLQPETFRLFLIGDFLQPHKSLASFELEEDDVIDLLHERPGGRPAVYLLPPTRTLNIQAKVSVGAHWRVSNMYPPTTVGVEQFTGESVTWTVDADPDGTFYDHGTGRAVEHLFWEARHQQLEATKVFRQIVYLPRITMFKPTESDITPANSVLLASHKVTNYIDNALLQLGVHSKARDAFITFWQPDLTKHVFVALRFIPQAEYERNTALNVTPVPDVITRVFMVFTGVSQDAVHDWRAAEASAAQDPSMWRDIVGVDAEKTMDPRLFRVIEWGGVEIR